MATTYDRIATTTLTSSASSIDFNSIPSTYDDLRLILVGKSTTAGMAPRLRFNNDTSSGSYSSTYVAGYGSTYTQSLNTSPSISLAWWTNWDNTYVHSHIIDILSYSSSAKYKPILEVTNANHITTGSLVHGAHLYRQSTAISSIQLQVNAYAYDVGTVATLYGIKAA